MVGYSVGLNMNSDNGTEDGVVLEREIGIDSKGVKFGLAVGMVMDGTWLGNCVDDDLTVGG